MDHTEALVLVAKAQFRPFDKSDYDSFAGVQSPNPYVGEYEDYLIIIDGSEIQVMDQDGNHCYSFTLGEGIQIF